MNKKIFINLILFFLIPAQLLIFIFFVPPFQKPDEQPHFEKSLLISKGYFFCKEKSNNTIPLEKKYTDFIKTPYLDLMTHQKEVKLPIPTFFNDLFSNNQSNKKISFNVDHLCGFPIISYIPQAFVLWILSFFNANPIQSIYFVRLMMAILGYFWFLYLYRKIAENYKLILLFTFALPMSLHQVSSFSYDAIHIMLALTFFTLIINKAKSVINHAPVEYFKLFFVLFLFLWSKKIGYETFFLFLFLVPFEIKPMIIFSLIFIPFYFWSKLTGTYDLQYSLTASAINPIQQINSLISDPLNILIVLAKTSIERFPFYLQSLIGVFGWLEYGLDPLSYLLYGLFFIYVIVKTRHASSLHKYKTILLFLTLIISYIFILLLAFVFNTEPGSLIAHGVQGRYFIPLLPFVILLIVQFTQKITLLKKIKVGEYQKNIFYILIIAYLISSTFFSVFNRYY
ncbi:MAG: DUF2142 domain-containing protein [Patescibacteria group bacterium]|jgi:uncharacterized membrane protein